MSTGESSNPQGQQDRRHFKVPHLLRRVNQTAYEPELVAIGPCHRQKEHLQDMEEIKKQYFSRLLRRKGGETRNKCFDAMREMEEAVRNWYCSYLDDSIKKEAIVEMMVVDACFIIELLCEEPQDQIAEQRWSRIILFGDLLLLENQLPFFVLVKLYGLIKDRADGTELGPQAFAKLMEVLPVSGIETVNPATINVTDRIDHLLGLVHANWEFRRHQTTETEEGRVERQSIGCATELKEAGIQFIQVESNQESLFNVDFKDGKMKIPTFVVKDDTERLLRNLIAYELVAQDSTYVIDYVILMDNLVNTAKDVKMLRRRGIIQNRLGDDEAVAKMIKKLGDHVALPENTFFYKKMFEDVKRHCKRPYNTWMRKLRRDYFSSPWSCIAFVAGLVVFGITITNFIRISFLKD